MRMSGSRRLILNTNMWTEMKCEKADSRRIRFTGQDFDTGQIRIFLVTVSAYYVYCHIQEEVYILVLWRLIDFHFKSDYR